MNIIACEDYATMSARATALVIAEVENRPDLLVCTATGQSPIGLYEELARRSATSGELFEALRLIQLDEWCGIPEDDPASCGSYIRTHLLEPMGIPRERFLGFASNPSDPAQECKRIRAELERRGPIDLCILGLGANGHIGFNEPGPFLTPHCHVAHLSNESRRHTMVRSLDRAPHLGMTLGMQEILASRKIVLLVSGKGKSQTTEELMSGKISTTLPATLLWLHDNVDCLIDRSGVGQS